MIDPGSARCRLSTEDLWNPTLDLIETYMKEYIDGRREQAVERQILFDVAGEQFVRRHYDDAENQPFLLQPPHLAKGVRRQLTDQYTAELQAFVLGQLGKDVREGARVHADSFLVYRGYSNTIQRACSSTLHNYKLSKREETLDGLLSTASAGAAAQPLKLQPMQLDTPAEYLSGAIAQVLDQGQGGTRAISESNQGNFSAQHEQEERLWQLHSCLQGRSLPGPLREWFWTACLLRRDELAECEQKIQSVSAATRGAVTAGGASESSSSGHGYKVYLSGAEPVGATTRLDHRYRLRYCNCIRNAGTGRPPTFRTSCEGGKDHPECPRLQLLRRTSDARNKHGRAECTA